MAADTANSAPAITLGEYAQAKIRCWMNFALMILGLLAYRRDPTLSLALVWYTFLFTAVSAASLLFWARAIARCPPHSKARLAQRIASIVLDNVSISWILYFGGEALAGVFSVYLWISIGYGMRFGLRYLFANLAASAIGFAVVASQSSFWRDYSSLSIGLGAGLVVIAFYTAYLITQLHEAVRRAESASRAKSDFLAKMSHELRTPLHGIIALADLLGGTDSQSQKQEMLRQISVSSNTLLDLINRILDISKYESGTFALQAEPMNLQHVLDDTVSILSSQARAKNIELSAFYDAAVESRLIGSPRQLQEIMINLAGNALKFTDRGSVRIGIIRLHGDSERSQFRISISDTGPGIPKEYLARIFDPFTQADDSITRLHGGSGLGTTIARDLVHLMQGEIAIESDVGVGTTVTVDLALARAPQPTDEVLHYPLRIATLGTAEVTGEFADALRNLSGAELMQQAVGIPDGAECVFLDINALELLDALDDPIPPAIGFGPASALGIALARPDLLAYVDDLTSEAQLRRALDLVMLARSRAQIEDAVESMDAGHSILIAEDNATNQMIARIALERAGFDCTIVDDGEKALDELSSGRHDIALIDMHMPRMDGLEVARLYNFAAFDAPSRTPIIMLTADNRPEALADADLAGIDRFLIKPIKPSALLRVVNDVLEAANEGRDQATLTSVVEMSTREAEAADLDIAIFGELQSFMDPAEARQFFAEFRHDARGYITTLKNFAAGQVPLKVLRDDMHALCGAARTIGAMRLAALARRIEYAAETDLREQTALWLEQLETAMAASMRLVEQRLSAAA